MKIRKVQLYSLVTKGLWVGVGIHGLGQAIHDSDITYMILWPITLVLIGVVVRSEVNTLLNKVNEVDSELK